MTRRTKTLLIAVAGFAVAVLLIVTTAYGSGADPFHPRTRHIWALSLVAALYASVRGAVFVERMLHRRRQGYDRTLPGLPDRSFFRGREHAIDRRMAQRRARVEAAKAKQAQDDADKTDDAI